MNKNNIIKTILLLITAIIWGSAFVAQSVGTGYVGPFTFNFVRNILGGLVLLPVIWIMDKLRCVDNTADSVDRADKSAGENELTGSNSSETSREGSKTLIIGGVCCGIALCVASNLQQFGLMHTTVGKAGFITALYIIIVPVIGIFLKKKCGVKVWLGVVIALAGFYLLSVKDGFTLEQSDIYLLCSAIMFSVHILLIDHFSPKVDGVKMSCLQFFVCGIISGIIMLITETPTIAAIRGAWIPLAYSGILSCGVAYTLQIVAQKDYNPTVASLVLSLESVFSALAGWLILHQELSARELTGCALIFCAIILAQLPSRLTKGDGVKN